MPQPPYDQQANPSHQPQSQAVKDTGQTEPGGSLQASALVRSSPPLPLSNGFNMLNVDLDSSDKVVINDIALGAHPICDND